jgi:hypothetical protein
MDTVPAALGPVGVIAAGVAVAAVEADGVAVVIGDGDSLVTAEFMGLGNSGAQAKSESGHCRKEDATHGTLREVRWGLFRWVEGPVRAVDSFHQRNAGTDNACASGPW